MSPAVTKIMSPGDIREQGPSAWSPCCLVQRLPGVGRAWTRVRGGLQPLRGARPVSESQRARVLGAGDVSLAAGRRPE